MISLAVALLFCVTGRGRVVDLQDLLNLSRDMLSFLGVIAAILIAVTTTIYVLSEQKRREGFLAFLQALNRLREVPGAIENSRETINPAGDGSAELWSDLTRDFIVRMNEIRPTWGGYTTEPRGCVN